MTRPSPPPDIITERPSWNAVFQSYLKPKMLAMLALGFSSGLPFMMFFSKLSRWLSDVGIDKTTIGFFFWIGLAYSFKFLWAPIVDRGRIPLLTSWLGQRRSWMMISILGTIIGMMVISGAAPSPNIKGSLLPIIIGAFILTYSGATLDIAVDAWRIESGSNEEQANLAAVYHLGYRFAIMAAGYALIIADIASWRLTYWATAIMMAVIAAIILFIREPDSIERRTAQSFKEGIKLNVVIPFIDIFTRLGRWIVPVFGLTRNSTRAHSGCAVVCAVTSSST